MMGVLLFVCDMSMLREYMSTRVNKNDGGGTREVWLPAVSAGHEYMDGTLSSGIVSSADDVLEMSVVRMMRGVGGVCEICMCLARDWALSALGEYMWLIVH